ncbi:hypothetical protein [Mycobacterium marseillense]|uniref:hypothetical protein n=1 Tax=Mycobacterium marseillense TaxID=701042 RepID=UPI000A8B32A7|nr:hypothetical protein [Mycobacterium marseillense]MCA2265193.1 hypothetical protein [Mycobacterium marseillense]
MSTSLPWLGAPYDYSPPADLVSQSPADGTYEVGDGSRSTGPVPENIVIDGRFEKGV